MLLRPKHLKSMKIAKPKGRVWGDMGYKVLLLEDMSVFFDPPQNSRPIIFFDNYVCKLGNQSLYEREFLKHVADDDRKYFPKTRFKAVKCAEGVPDYLAIQERLVLKTPGEMKLAGMTYEEYSQTIEEVMRLEDVYELTDLEYDVLSQEDWLESDDIHAWNWAFREDGSLVIYDFGM